jgi:hypothetical protein
MVDNQAESTPAGWRYQYTWMRDHEEGDRETIVQHLEDWASAGWELVSANAVQHLAVRTDVGVAFGGPAPQVHSSSVMRHYFYWRKRWEPARS